MSNIFFTSDLHFGHANVIRFDNRPFNSIEEMDSEIIKRWNQTVNKNDTVYILGDISWYKDDKIVEIFSHLNGHKRLVKGNHDRIHGKVKNCFDWIGDYEELNINGKKVVLCHYPIHFYNGHYHGSVMFYGHVHNSKEETMVQEYRRELDEAGIPCKMYNVGCMWHGYTPRTFEEIIN